MDISSKRVLLIGASGAIGKHLKNHWQLTANIKLCTAGRSDQDDYYLDLNSPSNCPAHLFEASHFDTVVVLAAMSNIAACERDPQLARYINAKAVEELYHIIPAKNWILFSTNQVFCGDKLMPRRNDITQPISEYGASKVALEKCFESQFYRVAILRLTKVLMPEQPFLRASLKKMLSGEKVTAFTNMVMAPIYIEQVCQYITRLLFDFSGGIHQLSGQRDISYYQTLVMLSSMLDLDVSLVEASKTGINTPKYSALHVDTLENSLGFFSPDIESVLGQFLAASRLN
ncbi:sugar nucleotide-binding protein [Planctobacterium marinum]|uniref:RmlD-like substrate binding domain-containing protein n=1 Tax=Planctobacterium marinum TaxID=1631968 RepID=A0AA48HS83_9ALTE|nr:hypothetical protein MACH26_32880 [Planctobacterium marinum]